MFFSFSHLLAVLDNNGLKKLFEIYKRNPAIYMQNIFVFRHRQSSLQTFLTGKHNEIKFYLNDVKSKTIVEKKWCTGKFNALYFYTITYKTDLDSQSSEIKEIRTMSVPINLILLLHFPQSPSCVALDWSILRSIENKQRLSLVKLNVKIMSQQDFNSTVSLRTLI